MVVDVLSNLEVFVLAMKIVMYVYQDGGTENFICGVPEIYVHCVWQRINIVRILDCT